MRIIAAPDGTVNRLDRALWLTPPFDLAWYLIVVPACRKLIVSEDLRTLTAADNRILLVEADNRTLTTGC